MEVRESAAARNYRPEGSRQRKERKDSTNAYIHRWVAKLACEQDRRFLSNSVRVLSQDRCIPLGYMGLLTTGSPTGSLLTFGESGLNVQSGHCEDLVFGSKVRAVLHRDWVH